MMQMWAISFLLCAVLALMAQQATADAFVPRPAMVSVFSLGRGGATVSAEEATVATEEESDDEETEVVAEDDEDEEEEEEEEDNAAGAKLAAATIASAAKTKSKAAAEKMASIKTEVNKKLASSSKITKKKNKSFLLRIPYILRACLNPITLLSMTKAYWASLVNLDYLKKADSSQDLRSALEEKAKKGGSGPAKGRRKMKRGQAKTLSDLPQLNT